MADRDPVVWVLYEHDDALWTEALNLRVRLKERLGTDRVASPLFWWRFSSQPDDPELSALLDPPGVALVIIGQGWAQVVGPFAGRAYNAMLDAGVHVVPVLVNGAAMPAESDLPADLRPLLRLNAMRLNSPAYTRDVDLLVEHVVRLLEAASRPVAASGAGRPPAPPERPAPGVTAGPTAFISYRRAVSWSTARLVTKDLLDHGIDAFLDTENIDNGVFEQVILTQITARAHFVVVLEPGTLDRIAAPRDWLRREIAHAITSGRNVVPLLCNGFTFAAAPTLPPDIARLPDFNAVTVPVDYVDAAFTKLRERFLVAPPPTVPAPAATAPRVRQRLAEALTGIRPRQ